MSTQSVHSEPSISEAVFSLSSTAGAVDAHLGHNLGANDGAIVPEMSEGREAILKQLYAHRAQLLDALDAGRAHAAAELELEELDRAIDVYEMAEHRSQRPVETDAADLSAITRELMAIQALLSSAR